MTDRIDYHPRYEHVEDGEVRLLHSILNPQDGGVGERLWSIRIDDRGFLRVYVWMWPDSDAMEAAEEYAHRQKWEFDEEDVTPVPMDADEEALVLKHTLLWQHQEDFHDKNVPRCPCCIERAVDDVPPGRKLRETLRTSDSDKHTTFNGQPFQLLRWITEPDATHDAEVLPMAVIYLPNSDTEWEVFEDEILEAAPTPALPRERERDPKPVKELRDSDRRVTEFVYEPGDGTRYEFVLAALSRGKTLFAWVNYSRWHDGAKGGHRCMVIAGGMGVPDEGYIHEKMGFLGNDLGWYDAEACFKFLCEQLDTFVGGDAEADVPEASPEGSDPELLLEDPEAPKVAGWYLLTPAGWSGPHTMRYQAADAGRPLGFTTVKWFSGKGGAS